MFWCLDSVKGGNVRRHYADIKFILENLNTREAQLRRSTHLKNLLRHATHTTPFYSGMTSYKMLTDFPVVNKNTIRENYEAFVSSVMTFKKGKFVVTSGSTGTPFTLKHDIRKIQRNTADAIYFGELAGYKLGQRLYYFKIWNEINKKSRLSQFAQNIVPLDVSALNDHALDRIIKKLAKDKSNKSVLAYASVYDALGSYILSRDSERIKNISAVIAMSEALEMNTKNLISEFLNAVAVSRYSNMENGIIAQQMIDKTQDFLINDASYYVEVLELESEKPVSYGVPGRIILTDLFNYANPIIRYDTGDIGSMMPKEIFGDLRNVFTSIEGRRMDLLYDTSGSLISSYIITNNMWKYNEISQYQLIQNSANEYLFKLNIKSPFRREIELINEFSEYLGKDAKITVEYVTEIPVLASAKRRKVVNNYSPNLRS